MNPEPFMRRAIELARNGMQRGDGGPFGAVVVRDGTIIGEGWNRVVADNDPTAHGEVTAIRDACTKLGNFDLTGCEIHTTGEPCPMCLGAIHWARIGRIYYGFRIEDAARGGFDDLKFYDTFARPAGDSPIPASELLAQEANLLIDEFLKSENRKNY
ncbi:nucleoside deaminase [Haloferula rosea]|uniref:Nucleoside deaminase n=1 Tax=Haloferula rosea TaxID=490093 RepID=A0A934R9N3_9BACT|nr:nucleoside deaminase [Haloferula rosea]MBK1826568.1 nucleoside deaminase [Haloferula rosea]